jgi:TolB-like protein
VLATVASLVLLLAVIVGVNGGKLRVWLWPGITPTVKSLAVLPLANLSGDPQQEYFTEGMTDQLISDLAKVASLRVISRTSVMQYKNTKKTIPEIARELNVEGVIEGSILRSGDRVRITAQLGEAYLGKRMYAEAIAELSRAAELMRSRPGYSYSRAVLGSAYAKAGDTASARKVLAEVARFDQPFEAALIYAELGDRDRSIALLNEAYRRHDISLELNFVVELDPLRSDPRFRDLVRRVGLPQ